MLGYPSADSNELNSGFFPRITDEINEVINSLGTIRALLTINTCEFSVEERRYNDEFEKK